MANCFTEFHVDFGGTSVWYSVQKGAKYFFVVKPTPANIMLHEEWLNHHRAGLQTTFFGSLVEKGECECVRLNPGDTLILPAAWLHAVYTPEDSLVYGGNFLHEYSIGEQMTVLEYENRLKVGLRAFKPALFAFLNVYR